MARFASFGEALKEARIRKGIEAHAAAKKLRIRTDILRAIEEADFASLPAKGYCKNMISSYARMVGLNPEEIVKQYLEEAYSFEVGRVRESSRYEPRNARSYEASRNRNMPARDGRGGRIRVADDRYSRNRDDNAYSSSRVDRSQDLSFDERLSRARTPNTPARTRENRSERQNGSRGFAREQRARSSAPGLALPSGSRSGNLSQGNSHRTRRSRSSLPTPSTHYSSMVSSPKRGNEPSKIPFLAAGVAVLIVLALLAVLVFGGKNEDAVEDLPDVPISGLTDTSTPVDAEADASVPTPPTSAEFGYKVPEGQSAYIEIYVDGADSPSEAATVEGSTSKRYEVTGTLKFVTTNPTGVSITVDGETVSPTDDDGNGVYVYTVDFASILTAWNEANQVDNTSSDSGDATAEEGSTE